MNFVGLAKAFLPKDSPWFQRIEQAQQIAAQFPSTKGGLTDLMRQYNINQEKFQQALGALNNPMISGMLNRFQPGLTAKLRFPLRKHRHPGHFPVEKMQCPACVNA